MQRKNKQSNFNKPKSRIKNYSKDFSKVEEKIIWKYSQNKNNDFWFVDVEWIEKWYFVYPKNSWWALDWDEVEAVLKTFNGRKEAVITKVLKRADRILVWTIELKNKFAFVILDNPLFKKDIFLSYKKIEHTKVNNWDKVAIKITRWDWKSPEWRIIEVLWDKNKPWVEVESLILEIGRASCRERV